MRVLVTGGAGFIGSHIVDALLARGHEVAVLDDFSTGSMFNVDARLEWGTSLFNQNVRHSTNVMEVVEYFRPDAICHQAAQPSLRCSIEEPVIDAQVNIIGTLNVIQAAKACGAHVVFASTSAVYAPGWTQPYREDHELAPNVPYGIAKMAAERYLRTSGVSMTILRYGNVYGPRQVQVGENQLIPHCLAHLLNDEPFVINGDGEQTRDFVYVGDIARANVLAIEGRVQGVFNCGCGARQGVSVKNMGAMLARLTNYPHAFQHGPAKPSEARHVVLDSSRARQVLGWQAETPLDQGLRRTIAWWKEQRCVSV